MDEKIIKRTSTPKVPSSHHNFSINSFPPLTPILRNNNSSLFEPMLDLSKMSVDMKNEYDEDNIVDDSLLLVKKKENVKDESDILMKTSVDKSIVEDSFAEEDEGNISLSSNNDISRERSALDTPQGKKLVGLKQPEIYTPQTRKDREYRLERKKSSAGFNREYPITLDETECFPSSKEKTINLSDDEAPIRIDSSSSSDDDSESFSHGKTKRRIRIESSSEESLNFSKKEDSGKNDSSFIQDNFNFDKEKPSINITINSDEEESNDESDEKSVTINSSSVASIDESNNIQDSDSDGDHQTKDDKNMQKSIITIDSFDESFENTNLQKPITIDSSDESSSENEKPVVLTSDEKLSVEKMTECEVVKELEELRKFDSSYTPDGGYKIKRRIALLEYRLTLSFEDDSIIEVTPKSSIEQADMEKYLNGEKRMYGGKMTEARLNTVQTVTEEALKEIHSSLEKRPENVITETPKGITVDLMMHQKHSLTTMIWCEERNPRGGILADDMGLGKTLSMISLIVAQKNARKESAQKRDELKKAMVKHFSQDKDVTGAFSTLVVAPASVIFQWEKEIKDRVEKGKLSVCVYHGPKREKDPYELSRYDVVITTYNIISSELGEAGDDSDDEKKSKKSKKVISKDNKQSVLTQIGWERIVLDEAHIIKNRRSLTSKGCCRLLAFKRWALTGTPIHNDLWDFYSLIRFLRVPVFTEEMLWKELMMNSHPTAAERLNTLVKSILIRRTKNQICPVSQKPLIDLKPRTFEVIEITLEGLEDKIYQHMFEASKQKVKELMNEQNGLHTRRPQNKIIKNPFLGGQREINSDDNFQMMSCVLVLLLRLRQACVHMALTSNAVDMDAFKEDGGDEDAVMDELEKTFGNISLGAAELFEKEKVETIFLPTYVSGKMKILLEKLEKVIEAGDKCVIVSQWTSMLDIIEIHLKKKRIEITTISGKVLTKDRQERINSFNKKNGGAQVMLLSLTAGGVGLNLVGGNHLFLVDLHWNPALEKQAYDRIYRVGQQKDVFIHKFICKDTVEQKVLDLQEKKTQLADSVLEGAAAKGRNKLTFNDLKFLFGLNKEKNPQPKQPYQGPANVRNRI